MLAELMSETDDEKRSGPGVVVSARDLDGRVRLILDDVSPDGQNPVQNWKKRFFFTWIELELAEFESGQASDEFYRDLGRMVAVRLHARRTVGA